jgi:hypothetical protein
MLGMTKERISLEVHRRHLILLAIGITAIGMPQGMAQVLD